MVNTTLFFIFGLLTGSGITAIAFKLGANAIENGIKIITEPQDETSEEEELDELISDSYNYDTYTNYIEDLEQKEDEDPNLPN